MTEHVLNNGGIVVATLRKPEVLAGLSAQFPASKLLVLRLDVSNPDEIVAAFAKAKDTFGHIDVVFNNAGFGTFGEVEGTPEDKARSMFDVNFWGAANVSREAVKFFRDVNRPIGGRLLQVSSLAGIKGFELHGYYNATKFALEGLSEALAAELDPDWNIKISLIELGAFRTNALNNAAFLPPHPAYTKPVLASAILRKWLQNPDIKGDSQRAVEAMYRLAALPDPPLHLPLGKDAVQIARSKIAILDADTTAYESWSNGLDHD